MTREALPVNSNRRGDTIDRDVSDVREMVQERWSVTLRDEDSIREFSRSLATLPD